MRYKKSLIVTKKRLCDLDSFLRGRYLQLLDLLETRLQRHEIGILDFETGTSIYLEKFRSIFSDDPVETDISELAIELDLRRICKDRIPEGKNRMGKMLVLGRKIFRIDFSSDQ